MGKIYGVHSSYCSMLTGEQGGQCTCEAAEVQIGGLDRSGMRILMEDAARQQQANDYAIRFVEDFKKLQADVSAETLTKVHEVMKQRWFEAHPIDAPPAAPEPTDGPGEEDGPWAEGWGERAGVPGHAEWFEDNKSWIRMAHPRRTKETWDKHYAEVGRKYVEALDRSIAESMPAKERIAANILDKEFNTGGPLGPKDDHFKPKPFKFFFQQFPLGLRWVANHMEKGCDDPGHVFLGWQGVEDGFQRYTDAMLRHLTEEVIRTVTDVDKEEGRDANWMEEQHATAVAANAMIRLELLLRKRRSLNLAREATA